MKKKEYICSCCADKAAVEVKMKLKLLFCGKHTVIDFYEKKVSEAKR